MAFFKNPFCKNVYICFFVLCVYFPPYSSLFLHFSLHILYFHLPNIIKMLNWLSNFCWITHSKDSQSLEFGPFPEFCSSIGQFWLPFKKLTTKRGNWLSILFAKGRKWTKFPDSILPPLGPRKMCIQKWWGKCKVSRTCSIHEPGKQIRWIIL